MRYAMILGLAVFAFFGLLGFWGDTAQSILGALVVLGALLVAVEMLAGDE